jgi:hypothetical protein
MAVVLGTSIGWANAWALGLEPRLDLAGGIQREEGKGRLSIKYSEYTKHVTFLLPIFPFALLFLF